MQTMKKVNGAIVQEIPVPGIASCVVTHKIASTESKIDYLGPVIPHDEWHRLMSFFRWTYQTYHGEAQARGFIDMKDKKVIFWPFPQKARTGMSSDEIPGEEFNKQRAALPNSDSLIYFFTNHHHCGCSAFQSGGDTNNEERPGGGAHETGQDGLHITMGKMDEEMHDIDVRFYLSGMKCAPRLSSFWDIGEEVKKLIPKEMHDAVAKFQMCQKVELPFPEEWKANMIEEKQTGVIVSGYGSSHVPSVYQGGLGYGAGWNDEPPMWKRCDTAAEDVLSDMHDMADLKLDTAIQVMEFADESPIMKALFAASDLYKVDMDMLVREVLRLLIQQRDQKEEEAEAKAALDNGDNSRKNRRRRKKGNDDDTKTIRYPGPGHTWNQEKREWIKNEEAVPTPPLHGQSDGQGRHWDSDLKQWVFDY